MSDASEPGRRKLTTVLCADAVGFSAQTERDEAGTLTGLKADRAIMAGVIERQHGRVVNTWGDGLLAEFESPVEAVSAAAEIQRTLGARPEASGRLSYRIGINLGDVIIDGDDLLGDGVNVAARLQGEAEPGGICISRTVFDQVGNKLSLGFQFLGEQPVKNLSVPVPVYRVLLGGQAANPGASAAEASAAANQPVPLHAEAEDPRAAAELRFRRHLYRGVGLIIFLFLVNLFSGSGHWWFKWPALGISFFLFWKWWGLRWGVYDRPSDRNRAAR